MLHHSTNKDFSAIADTVNITLNRIIEEAI